MNFPLEPNQLLQLLHDDLKPWVAARKGVLSLAGDPGDVLESLSDAPKSFRVVLAWAGDEDQTGQAAAGIVDNTFEVWLIKAKGLKFKSGEHLIKGDPRLLRLLSDLRLRIRSLAFPDEVTNEQLLYKGAKPYPNHELAYELPTAGYVMRFELTTAIPHIDLRG